MANEILKTLLPFAGWSEDRTKELTITGGTDPILPTSRSETDLHTHFVPLLEI